MTLWPSPMSNQQLRVEKKAKLFYGNWEFHKRRINIVIGMHVVDGALLNYFVLRSWSLLFLVFKALLIYISLKLKMSIKCKQASTYAIRMVSHINFSLLNLTKSGPLLAIFMFRNHKSVSGLVWVLKIKIHFE